MLVKIEARISGVTSPGIEYLALLQKGQGQASGALRIMSRDEGKRM